MFWLSCEVLYNLDQKHMKQGCYIGNTTEKLLQHGGVFARFSFSVVSLFVLVYVPRLLSSLALPLHLCRCGGTVLLQLNQLYGGHQDWRRRIMGGQKIIHVAPGSQICARTERFRNTVNPLIYTSLSSVLGKQKHLQGFFEANEEKKTLISSLAFYVVIIISLNSFKIGLKVVL